MPGTVWRALRPLLLLLLLVAIGYGLICAGVAVTTANKCGGAHLSTPDKQWNWFPPEWDCVSRLPGQG